MIENLEIVNLYLKASKRFEDSSLPIKPVKVDAK
jgi:hypothetical protein